MGENSEIAAINSSFFFRERLRPPGFGQIEFWARGLPRCLALDAATGIVAGTSAGSRQITILT
jgi:hypothetical protein